MSSLSTKSLELLFGLVDEKLSCLEVFDREDAREKSYLESTRRELESLMRVARITHLTPAPKAAA